VKADSEEWKMLTRIFAVCDPESLGIGRDVAVKTGEKGARSQLYDGLSPLMAWKVSSRRRAIYDLQVSALAEDKNILTQVCEMQQVSTKLDGAAKTLGMNANVNERILLHGTKPQNLMAILRNGLNERVSSGHFGAAVYLTEDPSKSDQYCVPDDGTDDVLLNGLYTHCGLKHPGNVCYAIVCRAALGFPLYTKNGRFALDRAGMGLYSNKDKRELTAIPGSQPPVSFHSLVVQAGPKSEGFALQRHREFLVFNSNNILLEYVVAYQRTLNGAPAEIPLSVEAVAASLPTTATTTERLQRSGSGQSAQATATPVGARRSHSKEQSYQPAGIAPKVLSRTASQSDNPECQALRSLRHSTSSLSRRSDARHQNLMNLVRDVPTGGRATVSIKSEVLKISGTQAWNCWNGKRDNAPIMWVKAPHGGERMEAGTHSARLRPPAAWTAWVKCRFEAASQHAAVMFTVYEGPDTSGAIGFSFGPRTLNGQGIGYQATDSNELNAFAECDISSWHELRMRRYNGIDGGSLFDLAFRPLNEDFADDMDSMNDIEPEEDEWIMLAEAIQPYNNIVGKRIALGVMQASSGRCEVHFRDFKLCRDNPDGTSGPVAPGPPTPGDS
jgi:hypothetical protein